MLTNDEFSVLVSASHESYSVEFKTAGLRTSGYFFATIARACLGLANIRDGGWVIIGVNESEGVLDLIGLDEAQRTSWIPRDAVIEGINKYADPPLQIEVYERIFEDKTFLVIEVGEFAELPVLCRTGYNEQSRGQIREILRAGACYVRNRRKPATTEIPSQTEMRELLDLAIQKGVRRFIERVQAAGISVTGAVALTDEDRFREQRRELGDGDG